MGDVGDRFFVGAFVSSLPGSTAPAAADFTGPFEEAGWAILTAAGALDPSDLSAIQPLSNPSVFMLRTISAPGFALAADLDCDGSVGPGDLGLLLGAWGPCPTDPDGAPIAPLGRCVGDLNSDGVVDGIDLGLLLGVWE